MKKVILSASFGIMLLLTNCSANNTAKEKTDSIKVKSAAATVVTLTDASFKQKVFNYDVNKTWKYEGDMPAIIDFYATWCGPCKMLSPIIEDIAKQYGGKIIVYKVDTDVERILSQNMGIQSLPTLLFIPKNGQPQAAMGFQSKEALEKIINEFLLK